MLRQSRKISCLSRLTEPICDGMYLRRQNWTRGGGCRSVITSMKKPFSEEKLHSSDFLPWIMSMSVCRRLWNTEHDFSYTELKGNPGCRTGLLEYKFPMSVCREVSTVLSALLRILLWVTNHSVQKILTKYCFLDWK